MRQLKINASITRRDSQTLEIYLNQIGHEPLITPEEEVELANASKKETWLHETDWLAPTSNSSFR